MLIERCDCLTERLELFFKRNSVKHFEFLADLQGRYSPSGWRHTVQHLEDPTAYILQLSPNHKKQISKEYKKTLSKEKGRFFTAWEVADASFFKVN